MNKRDIARRVVAHRGLWVDPDEANTPAALREALRAGFGIETDIRDRNGKVVVSHDPPLNRSALFSELIRDWTDEGIVGDQCFALNVKSDGLVPMMGEIEELLKGRNYFFFDMSFPQLLAYSRAGFPISLRVSELEPAPVDLTRELGVAENYLLDGFASDWWIAKDAMDDLVSRSQVTVISPEIHGRQPYEVWDWFIQKLNEGCDLYLCTDLPIEVLERVT